MGNYSVMKCACCDKKFSQIEVLRLSATRSREIAALLTVDLHTLGAKGSAELVEIDGMIVGVIYEYADQHESTHSEEICKTIGEVFEDLDQDIKRTCRPSFVDVS